MAFLCGVFASGAIGCRPQIAVAVLPMLLAAAWIAPDWRRRAWGLAGFAVFSLVWFLPLLAACGGPTGFVALLRKQGALVAQFDSGEARLPWSPQGLAFRFLAHPWGDRWTSFPILGLAALEGSAFCAAGPGALPRRPHPGHLAFCLPRWSRATACAMPPARSASLS
jgi:hypothetical protein